MGNNIDILKDIKEINNKFESKKNNTNGTSELEKEIIIDLEKKINKYDIPKEDFEIGYKNIQNKIIKRNYAEFYFKKLLNDIRNQPIIYHPFNEYLDNLEKGLFEKYSDILNEPENKKLKGTLFELFCEKYLKIYFTDIYNNNDIKDEKTEQIRKEWGIVQIKGFDYFCVKNDILYCFQCKYLQEEKNIDLESFNEELNKLKQKHKDKVKFYVLTNILMRFHYVDKSFMSNVNLSKNFFGV
jgi:hypothetical protein